MAARPNGFIIFTDDLDKTKRLSDSDFREWVAACVVYAQTGEVVDLSDMAALCFDFVKARIDEHSVQYEKTCLRNRENGKKGGRPPKATKTEENPLGLLETQQNPENPNIKHKTQNKKHKTENLNSASREGGTKGESRGGRDVRSFCEQQLAGNLPPEIRELYSQWSEAVRCGDMKRGLDLDAALSRAGYVADPRTGQLSKRNSAQKVSCS